MRAAGLPWAALWALLLPLVRTRGRAAGPRCRAGPGGWRCLPLLFAAGRGAPSARLNPGHVPGSSPAADRARAGPISRGCAGFPLPPSPSGRVGLEWPGGFGPPGRASVEASRFPPPGPGSSGRASSGHALGVAITNLMGACVDKPAVKIWMRGREKLLVCICVLAFGSFIFSFGFGMAHICSFSLSHRCTLAVEIWQTTLCKMG